MLRRCSTARAASLWRRFRGNNTEGRRCQSLCGLARGYGMRPGIGRAGCTLAGFSWSTRVRLRSRSRPDGSGCDPTRARRAMEGQGQPGHGCKVRVGRWPAGVPRRRESCYLCSVRSRSSSAVPCWIEALPCGEGMKRRECWHPRIAGCIAIDWDLDGIRFPRSFAWLHDFVCSTVIFLRSRIRV